MVSDYSKRYMIYQLDALEAFGGVLEQFEVNFGMKFVQVIPKNGFNEFLFWNHDTFERSNQVISRRYEFPSWSWAGWTGKVGFEIYREPPYYRNTELIKCWTERRTSRSPASYQSVGFSYNQSQDNH